MFDRLMHVAAHAFSYVRAGEILELQPGRAPGERPGRRTDTPEVEVVHSPGELKLTFQLPGAAPENTLVGWDAAVPSLWVMVSGASAEQRDLYVEVRLPANVAGEKSRCVLSKGGVLRVRVPEEDTPASTGLVLLTALQAPEPLTACQA